MQEDRVVPGDGPEDREDHVVVDEDGDGVRQARPGPDDAEVRGKLDPEDAGGEVGGEAPAPGRHDVPLAGDLGDPEGFQVAGQGGLGGSDALVLQPGGEFLLAVDGSGLDDFQDGLLSDFGVVLHILWISILFFCKGMHFYWNYLHNMKKNFNFVPG